MKNETIDRRASSRTHAPMFRANNFGPPAISLIRSKKALIEKYPSDVGLLLWVETAEIGDFFQGWERIT